MTETRAPASKGSINEAVIDELLELAKDRERTVLANVGPLDTKLAVVLASLGGLFTVGGALDWFSSGLVTIVGAAWGISGITAAVLALSGLAPRNYLQISPRRFREEYAAEDFVAFKDRLLSTYNEYLRTNLRCNRAKASLLRKSLWTAMVFVVLLALGGSLVKRDQSVSSPTPSQETTDADKNGP